MKTYAMLRRFTVEKESAQTTRRNEQRYSCLGRAYSIPAEDSEYLWWL